MVRWENFGDHMQPTKVLIIFLSLLLLIISAGCGGSVGVDTKKEPYTGTAILSWNIPATYSDGSQLSAANISEYRVYISTQSGTHSIGSYYPVSASTTNIYVKNFNLTVGQYFFCVTAVDSSGIESNYSREVSAVLK
jgi:hypothetical protein